MIMPGLINLDFADIRAVMAEMGKAMMGTGEAQGDRRALDAAEAAISNPLLDDVSMNGARGVLINITGGFDMTLYEVDEAANRIRDEVDPEANIIFGSTFDEKLNGSIRVSVVATGIGDARTHISTASRDHSQAQTTTTTQQSQGQGQAAAPTFASRDYGFQAPSGFTPPSAFTPPQEISSPFPTPQNEATFYPSYTNEGLGTTQNAGGQSTQGTPNTWTSSQGEQEMDLQGNSMGTVSESMPNPAGEFQNCTSQDSKSPYQPETGAPKTASEITLPESFLSHLQPDSNTQSQGSMGAEAQGLNSAEPIAERKRPTSLFERFTGVARGRSAATESKSTVSAISTSNKVNSEEADMLEIPAFLRRDG